MLPSHYKIEIHVLFFSIDKFLGKILKVFYDEILVASYTFYLDSTTAGFQSVIYNSLSQGGYFSFSGKSKYGFQILSSQTKECGTNNPDSIYALKIIAEHNSSNITIKFSIIGNPEKGDWGVKNIYYYIWSEELQTVCLENCIGCDAKNCEYCPTGSLNQENVCVTACSANYFFDSTNVRCYTCYSSCATCTSNNPGSCLTCNVGYYAYGNYCIISCPNNTYQNISSQTCVPCDETCLTCFGSLNNQCLSCNSSLFFENNSCELCHTSCLTCGGAFNMDCLSCFAGAYISSNFECLACDTSCYNCFGPSFNECLSCRNGSYLANGTCIGVCPINYYEDAIQNICGSCDASCYICNGPFSNNCLGCYETTSTFLNISTYECQYCDNSCQSCTGMLNSDCTSCLNGLYFSNGFCVSVCSLNQYLNSINDSCESCDSTCKSCFGPYFDNCEICYSNAFLDLNRCNINCPLNKFSNAKTNICEDFLNCSVGYYLNQSTNLCDKCDLECLSCESSSANCSSCNFGSFLIENSCFLCNEICLSCNGTSKNNCLTCTDSFIFENSTCLRKNCNFNEYWDNSRLQCIQCDNSCKSCYGYKLNNCLSCANGLTFILNQCIEVKSLYFSLISLKNPFEFLLSFTPNFTASFFQNLQETIIIKISNFRENLFQFSLKQVPQTTNFTLNLVFNDSIFPHTSYLSVFINASYDAQLILMNNSQNLLLDPYNVCPESIYYYLENGVCLKKEIYSYSWKYASEYNVIEILFNFNNQSLVRKFNPILADGVSKNIFYFQAESLSLNRYFTYSFVIKNDSVKAVLNFTDLLNGGINLFLKFNKSRFLEVQDSQKIIFIKKDYTIYIMDNYVDPSQIKIMEATKNLTAVGETGSTILLYASYVMNTKSSFAIRGLMILTLFQILKFIPINYPQNVRMIFTNSVSHLFIKESVIEIDENDQLSFGFPPLFLYYQTSLLLINNIINDYIMISIVLGICFLVYYFKKIIKCQILVKILAFLQSIFIWSSLFMICFSKYINTVFFVSLSFRFSWGFNRLNTLISFLFFCYIIFLPFHIWKIINLMNEVKNECDKTENNSLSPKKENSIWTISEDESNLKPIISSLKSMKKSNFFPQEKKIPESNFQEKKIPESNFPNEKINKVTPWNIFMEFKTPQLRIPTIKNLNSKNNLIEISDLEKNSEFFFQSSTNFLISSKKQRPRKNSVDLNIFQEKNPKTFSSNNSLKNEINNQQKAFTVKSDYSIISKLKGFFLQIFVSTLKILYSVHNKELFLKKFGILKRDLKEKKGLHHYYFVMDLFRYFTIASIVVWLYGYPLLQITIIFLVNLMSFLMIIYERPFKSRLNNGFNYFYEICIFLTYVSVFSLVVMDLNEDREKQKRLNIGWVIVCSYISLLASLLLNAFLRIFKLIVLLIMKIKK